MFRKCRVWATVAQDVAWVFGHFLSEKPFNGLSLSRMGLGNTVRVVPQVRPFLLKQEGPVPENYLIMMQPRAGRSRLCW